MFRFLTGAGALLCVLALLFLPLPLSCAVIAAAVLGLGFYHRAEHGPAAFIPVALAMSGLLMIGLSAPAAAAPAPKPPILSTLELQPAAQPLALSAPAVAPVVVQVAPSDTTVSVPLSDWISDALGVIQTLMLAVLAFVLRRLPAPLVWIVKAYGEQKIIDQAVALAVNAIPGAAKGEPLTIDVGNKVLAHALQWVVENVPGLLVKIMGGEDAIKAKIFAALNLEASASAAELGVRTTA